MKVDNINKILKQLVLYDKKTFLYIFGYAIFISILYLALPLSTQLIINRITHTALLQPIIFMSLVLVILLALAGVLHVLQKYLLEMYKRQSFVRLSSQLFMKGLYSDHNDLNDNLTNDLSSKYFEIFTIQDTTAVLFMEGLLLSLQIIVGFILSSFYHPYILVINIITIIIIYLTWKIFKDKAIVAAINRSKKKYKVYSWFDNVLNNSHELRNKHSIDFSIAKSRSLISEYINARVGYWRINLVQIIIFITLASFIILSIFSVGSFLVINGQLTLGQLIASEIIFTSAIFGISKLANYFDYYYELVASVDKISYLLELAECKTADNTTLEHSQYIFDYQNVIVDNKGMSYKYNLALPLNNFQNISLNSEAESLTLISLMKHKRVVIQQSLSLDELEYTNSEVLVIENINLFASSLICYLTCKISPQEIDFIKAKNLLAQLNLTSLVDRLDNGINSEIINNLQLSMREIVLLKLIRAILSRLDYIVIGGLVNILEDGDIQNIKLLFANLDKYLIIVNYKKY